MDYAILEIGDGYFSWVIIVISYSLRRCAIPLSNSVDPTDSVHTVQSLRDGAIELSGCVTVEFLNGFVKTNGIGVVVKEISN